MAQTLTQYLAAGLAALDGVAGSAVGHAVDPADIIVKPMPGRDARLEHPTAVATALYARLSALGGAPEALQQDALVRALIDLIAVALGVPAQVLVDGLEAMALAKMFPDALAMYDELKARDA